MSFSFFLAPSSSSATIPYKLVKMRRSSCLAESTLWLTILSSSILSSAQTCYHPNGDLAEDFTPCGGTGAVTQCYAGGQACTHNGLCFVAWDSSLNTGCCTDRTWADPACFQSCLNTTGRVSDISTLYRCTDNRWCCSSGGNTTSCCNDGDDKQFRLDSTLAYITNGTAFAPNYTIAPVSALQTDTSNGRNATLCTTDSSSSPSSAVDNSTLDLCPSRKSDGGDNHKAMEVGLGVGLGIGIPLLAALGGSLFMFSRKARQDAALIRELRAKASAPPDQQKPLAWQSNVCQELPPVGNQRTWNNPIATREKFERRLASNLIVVPPINISIHNLRFNASQGPWEIPLSPTFALVGCQTLRGASSNTLGSCARAEASYRGYISSTAHTSSLQRRESAVSSSGENSIGL